VPPARLQATTPEIGSTVDASKAAAMASGRKRDLGKAVLLMGWPANQESFDEPYSVPRWVKADYAANANS
jgi:hypothetical protein